MHFNKEKCSQYTSGQGTRREAVGKVFGATLTSRAILYRNLEYQVHESRQIGSGQTGDGKSEH